MNAARACSSFWTRARNESRKNGSLPHNRCSAECCLLHGLHRTEYVLSLVHPVYGTTFYIGADSRSRSGCNIGSGLHLAAAIRGGRLPPTRNDTSKRLSTDPDHETTMGVSLVQSVVTSLHIPHTICSASLVLVVPVEVILRCEWAR